VAEGRVLYPEPPYLSSEKNPDNKRKFLDERLDSLRQSKQVDELRQTTYRLRPATRAHPWGKKLVLVMALELEGILDDLVQVEEFSEAI